MKLVKLGSKPSSPRHRSSANYDDDGDDKENEDSKSAYRPIALSSTTLSYRAAAGAGAPAIIPEPIIPEPMPDPIIPDPMSPEPMALPITDPIGIAEPAAAGAGAGAGAPVVQPARAPWEFWGEEKRRVNYCER
jgi:hypothetical protein